MGRVSTENPTPTPVDALDAPAAPDADAPTALDEAPGAAVAPPPLADLVLALRSELAGCGFALDDRPYRPHATLARKATALEGRTLDPPIHWPVEAFVLACGQEGPPPRYRILRRWSLDGSC